uniref:Neuroguidin n=1 Tax=Callorhinchus milii TaxID=7868 RepID=V9L5H8_CALMI
MMAAQLEADVPSAVAALVTLKDQVSCVTAQVQALLRGIRSGSYRTSEGISFLEVKNQLLVSYLIDLSHVIALKAHGRSLEHQPGVLRLTEIRTVLEKMRPIDQKLRYQLDKLIKTAITGSLDDNNPLSFKPNPDNMLTKLDDEEQEDPEEHRPTSETVPKSKKLYIPPRLVPVHYDADETEGQREARAAERARKRALSSSVIRELRDQFSDAPQELREDRNYHTMRHSREDQHRVQYEESMLLRLNMTRRQRARRTPALGMTAQLSSLTRFGDIGALTGETQPEGEPGPARKRRKIIRKKGFKKGFRGRRR